MLLRRVQLNRRARNRTRLSLPPSLSLSLSAQRRKKNAGRMPGCDSGLRGRLRGDLEGQNQLAVKLNSTRPRCVARNTLRSARIRPRPLTAPLVRSAPTVIN
jgi:hypothetical protein